MSGGIYGGEDVGALVFDPGHFSFRVGYAGEDCPKCEIPSSVGYVDDDATDVISQDENKPPQSKRNEDGSNRQYFIDTNALHVPRHKMQVDSYWKSGLIDDWNMFESIIDYSYKKQLMTDCHCHPVLMTEPPLNTKLKREKLTELMFEKFDVPAFFLCKTAVLAAFANGKHSGLILDSGATHTSVVPVHDGYCLTNLISSTPLGSNFISAQCKQLLKDQKIDVIPTYQIASKDVVPESSPAKWKKKPGLPEVTKSYQEYMASNIIRDFQTTVLQVSDTVFDPEHTEKMPKISYEFPNGYHQEFGSERLKIPESLFNLNEIQPNLAALVPPMTDLNSVMGIGQIVQNCVNRCDADNRAALYNGIIITGGNTLLPGFVDRLNNDLTHRIPGNSKIKITSQAATTERRFGAWIGGSILSSLGTFQQMWISKQEYEESGKSIVEKKCP